MPGTYAQSLFQFILLNPHFLLTTLNMLWLKARQIVIQFSPATISTVRHIYLYFETEGKTEEVLTRDRENNSFSYIQQCSVQPGSMSDPWASHKSKIIGSQWRDVNIYHNSTGAETERYLSCSMYSDWKMMSQTSTGCTLIGFCYLESYLNPKLSAANWSAHLWL